MSKNNTVKQIKGKVDAIKWVEENGYPEVGMFTEQKDLQKFYKQLDSDTLKDWIGLEGLEYKECDSEPIQRMRMAMAILYKHFPKETSGTTKAKSKYADYTLEALIAMAVEHEVVFEICEDERILRMRAIMALRASKVLD